MKHSKDYIKGWTDSLVWVVNMLESDLFENDKIRDALKRGMEKVKEMEDG